MSTHGTAGAVRNANLNHLKASIPLTLNQRCNSRTEAFALPKRLPKGVSGYTYMSGMCNPWLASSELHADTSPTGSLWREAVRPKKMQMAAQEWHTQWMRLRASLRTQSSGGRGVGPVMGLYHQAVRKGMPRF